MFFIVQHQFLLGNGIYMARFYGTFPSGEGDVNLNSPTSPEIIRFPISEE